MSFGAFSGQGKSKTSFTAVSKNEGLRTYMLSVYNYMALALAITGLVSFTLSRSQALMAAIFGTPLAYVVAFAPIIFTLFYYRKLDSMTVSSARNGLLVYSVLMGLSLSVIFIAFTGSDIARAFFVTSALYGGMSLYGYTTKKDLSSMGSFLIMGVWGLFVASIVNIFLKSTGLQFAISAVSVLVFTGLTAYDTQKIRDMYYHVQHDGAAANKVAIFGALNLYMDFIALFINLLQLFGMMKDER